MLRWQTKYQQPSHWTAWRSENRCNNICTCNAV